MESATLGDVLVGEETGLEAHPLLRTALAALPTLQVCISEHDIVAYLNVALEDGDRALVQAALGDIARARGMRDVARKAGLGRGAPYKVPAAQGNPSCQTVAKVLGALALRLEVKPSTPAA